MKGDSFQFSVVHAIVSYELATIHRQFSCPHKTGKVIISQLCLAAAYLHGCSILHRDIKSDNILVSTQGDIKLADFGYATQLTKGNINRISKVGTVCWMAPEMIKGK